VPLNGVVERPQYRPGVFGGRMDVYTVQYGALGVAVCGWHLAGFDTYGFRYIPSALPRVECLSYPALFSISSTDGDVVAALLMPSCPL